MISTNLDLIASGIDGNSGDYLLPPLSPTQLAAILLGEQLDEGLLGLLRQSLGRSTFAGRTRSWLTTHHPRRDNDDPWRFVHERSPDLAETGWGVIFPPEIDPAIREALAPLLRYRSEQATRSDERYYREFDYRPGENEISFLARHGVSIGRADPARIPYHLLIVGDPQRIPYDFQRQLDRHYAVGRLAFNSPGEYANYAHSVVRAELNAQPPPRRVTLFGVRNPNDQLTQLSTTGLVQPLARKIQELHGVWEVALLQEGRTSKDDLIYLLNSDFSPALLLLTGHSLGIMTSNWESLYRYQGALVCENWQGPQKPAPVEFIFQADDVGPEARIFGTICFHVSSFSAGAAQTDEFFQLFDEPTTLSPQPFVARLPQRLLSHPQGGALAVIGHIERVWGNPFVSERNPQHEIFSSVMARLMRGDTVGAALDLINQQHHALANELYGYLQTSPTGWRPDRQRIADLWTAMVNFGGCVLLGDPAVRLMVEPSAQLMQREQTTMQSPEVMSTSGVVLGTEDHQGGNGQSPPVAPTEVETETPQEMSEVEHTGVPEYSEIVVTAEDKASTEPTSEPAIEDPLGYSEVTSEGTPVATEQVSHIETEDTIPISEESPTSEPPPTSPTAETTDTSSTTVTDPHPHEPSTATPPDTPQSATTTGQTATGTPVDSDTAARSPSGQPSTRTQPVAPAATPIAVAPLLRYEPPPATNTLSIEVGTKTITVRYKQHVYTGPNRIDRTALLRAWPSTQQYGETLFQGIIHDHPSPGAPAKTTTAVGYALALQETARELCVELSFDANDLDLHGLKWEYLKDPEEHTPLAVFPKSPLYRRLQGPNWKPQNQQAPLKILVAICNPISLGQPGNSYLEKMTALDTAQERHIVEQGMQRLQDAGLATYHVLSGEQGQPVTLAALREELELGYNVLHLLAHGLRIEGEYLLLFEDENQRELFVTPEQFEELLGVAELRLIVLAACQSALFGIGEVMQGLGPRLVRIGVPAVVAMQDLAPIDMAQFFTQHFYDDLARSGRVDMAMAATRLALFHWAGIDSLHWGIPTLLMGANEGQLFQVDPAKAATLEELKPEILPYEQLAGKGDPTPQRLMQTLIGTAQSYGANQELLTALRTLVAAQASSLATHREPETLAPRQDGKALTNQLPHKVKLVAADLKRYVEEQGSGLRLPMSVYNQVTSALNAGKHVIFIGPPGTGKSSLALDICRYACEKHFAAGITSTTATADWTTFDTVGGYVPTNQQTLQFRAGLFLRAICQGHWLVIDEINRAEIDKAFGELFTVLAGQPVELPYMVGQHKVRVLPAASSDPQLWLPEKPESYDYVIHPNWRILAAMNVYDKSYLFAMSFAFMRRFAFVDLEVPDETIVHSLIEDWLKRFGLLAADANQLDALRVRLHSLLKGDNRLMSRRAVGPAIVKDMLGYIADRYDQDPNEALDDLLCEACLLYIVPQLDGLDQDVIRDIRAFIAELFGEGATDESRLVRRNILDRIQLLYPHIRRWEIGDDTLI